MVFEGNGVFICLQESRYVVGVSVSFLALLRDLQIKYISAHRKTLTVVPSQS